VVAWFSTYFNRIYWFSASIVFIIICLRAFFIPFSHDEAATFFFYIQTDDYLPYKAHVYTNNHVLNSALANICYHIAGAHRFVLRIPNILSFVILCLSVYKLSGFLKQVSSKILLAGLFLLTFNFLDFFELCRGYGLSMACLVYSLSWLASYFQDPRFKFLLLFSLFLQLAVAANLILVVIAVILLLYMLIYQLKQKALFSLGNILLQLVNIGILFFWIKFSFFLKEKGALDYGVGENYWEVSFKTLIKLLYGADIPLLQGIIVVLFVITVIGAAIIFLQKRHLLENLYRLPIFFTLCLVTFILAFYLQKKLLDVNYPEDRTGLFYFVFLILSISFVLDEFKKASIIISALIVGSTFVHFILSFNLTHFTSPFYHTMSKKIYQQLEREHEKQNALFTIGGHRVRELNFAFMNYGGMLNPMDDSEEMQMNCDYYYAMKLEKPFYSKYYDEIGYDADWDHVLLKRKEPLEHDHFFNLYHFQLKGNREFSELKRIQDTVFSSLNPVEMYAEVKFNSVPKPFKAFLILQVNNEKNETIHYKRIILNWLDSDLNGKTRHLKLTSGTLPKKATIVVYLWNIEKQPVDVEVKNMQLYQLKGDGVNYRIPQEYYTIMYNQTKIPLL
jgi:hypothetical protein